MADILIRKVSDDVKERLVALAEHAGASLEAFLRRVLEEKAAEAPLPNDENVPFGTWAVSLFADLDDEVREEFFRNLKEIENLPAPEPAVFDIE